MGSNQTLLGCARAPRIRVVPAQLRDVHFAMLDAGGCFGYLIVCRNRPRIPREPVRSPRVLLQTPSAVASGSCCIWHTRHRAAGAIEQLQLVHGTTHDAIEAH